MIRILVVDDSALMRRQLSQIFADTGDFEIRTAKNGVQAVEENRTFRPDVVTLDINMPEMDGITALSLLMSERPVPVIMVSSLTEKGALATFEALNLGAVDYVTKPGGTISTGIDEIKKDLLTKVRVACGARLKIPVNGPTRRLISDRETIKTRSQTRPAFIRRAQAQDGLLLMAASTGGPRTLEEILRQLPSHFPWPILVAQHMPPAFTKSFAERLNQQCDLQVLEVATPMAIEPGTVYLGRGGGDMIVTLRGGQLTVLPKPESTRYLWHPSVELLGRSVLEHCDPAHVVAVMLTGMGYDGADAFAEIKNGGGRTIAESEASAAVFGMPSELIQRGGASLVLPVEKIAQQLLQWMDA